MVCALPALPCLPLLFSPLDRPTYPPLPQPVFPELTWSHGADLIFKDITVKGTILPGVSVLQEMMQMVCEHNIRSIVRTYKLDDVNKMVEHFHRPDMKGKFVVEFQGK